MEYVFEVIDKSKRKIHLSHERWKHICKRHPEVNNLEMIKECLEKSDKIINYSFDVSVCYYYKYFKHKKSLRNRLCVAVKYLNGEAYVVTAYFNKNIK